MKIEPEINYREEDLEGSRLGGKPAEEPMPRLAVADPLPTMHWEPFPPGWLHSGKTED